MPERIKSALFLDFDNIYNGLYSLDVQQAERMAADASLWIEELLQATSCDGTRDILVKRAYLNPNGYVRGTDNKRNYFSSYRRPLTQSGFEIVDCPELTGQWKNAADIRIVVDALEIMHRDRHFDEFVIASGDADFTPLLRRLRVDDRRTVVIAASHISRSYRRVADTVIDILERPEQQQGSESTTEVASHKAEPRAPQPTGHADGEFAPDKTEHTAAKPTGQTGGEKPWSEDEAAVDEAVAAKAVVDYIAALSEQVTLARMGADIHSLLGPMPGLRRWFGHGKLTSFISSIDSNYVFDNNYVYPPSRHAAEEMGAAHHVKMRRITGPDGEIAVGAKAEVSGEEAPVLDEVVTVAELPEEPIEEETGDQDWVTEALPEEATVPDRSVAAGTVPEASQPEAIDRKDAATKPYWWKRQKKA